MKEALSKVRETVQRLAGDHRDIHTTICKLGRAIDRVRGVILDLSEMTYFLILICINKIFLPQNFDSDFASVSREDVFGGFEQVLLLNRVICQHFYRHGMLDIAGELARVSL